MTEEQTTLVLQRAKNVCLRDQIGGPRASDLYNFELIDRERITWFVLGFRYAEIVEQEDLEKALQKVYPESSSAVSETILRCCNYAECEPHELVDQVRMLKQDSIGLADLLQGNPDEDEAKPFPAWAIVVGSLSVLFLIFLAGLCAGATIATGGLPNG